jgi:hypothetical protein
MKEPMLWPPTIGRMTRTTAKWIVGFAVMGARASAAPD